MAAVAKTVKDRVRKRRRPGAIEHAKRVAWGRKWGGAYHLDKLNGRWK